MERKCYNLLWSLRELRWFWLVRSQPTYTHWLEFRRCNYHLCRINCCSATLLMIKCDYRSQKTWDNKQHSQISLIQARTKTTTPRDRVTKVSVLYIDVRTACLTYFGIKRALHNIEVSVLCWSSQRTFRRFFSGHSPGPYSLCRDALILGYSRIVSYMYLKSTFLPPTCIPSRFQLWCLLGVPVYPRMARSRFPQESVFWRTLRNQRKEYWKCTSKPHPGI